MSGGDGETQERTWVAIAPRMDGRSPLVIMGTACAEAGVARDDSVAPDRRDVLPMLFDSADRLRGTAPACCVGVRMGREGEGGAGVGLNMQRVGATGRWCGRRSLGGRHRRVDEPLREGTFEDEGEGA
jgi:hypothetical protein